MLRILRFIVRHPLSKGQLLPALLRFVRWQLGVRLLRAAVVIPWVNESLFLARQGESGLTGNVYCGLMEFEEMAFLLHYLREEDRFFDVGANVGAYTILASRVVGASTVAFEPVPGTFEKLLDQVHLNRMADKVSAINCGVGAEAEALEFTTGFNNCVNRVNTDPANKAVVKVDVVTLDGSYQPSEPTCVKVDVEGYEGFVLRGGQRFFSHANVNAVVLEMNGSGSAFGVSDCELDQTMRGFGFKPIAYDPFKRTVREMAEVSPGGNVIYVKDVVKAQQRCASAPAVLIHTANGVRL